MQRIVKYPILLESLAKHLEKDSDEYKAILEAIKETKAILNHVNLGENCWCWVESYGMNPSEMLNLWELLYPGLGWQ